MTPEIAESTIRKLLKNPNWVLRYDMEWPILPWGFSDLKRENIVITKVNSGESQRVYFSKHNDQYILTFWQENMDELTLKGDFSVLFNELDALIQKNRTIDLQEFK